ncbi:hypothetical protein IQ254_24890 [Nodosilinea sp. LEGE 07088]|uniref:hypothetical protein n=1 Tax=Nodosilinea sp. LEGE 07088 TaxID=2777968 RepID=UPI0018827852|nr:hypothetical protein [Nodosilinea sp. LEGE 07088]MBE9140398.1 hypothetical protein [Nodosilinea sp. LEGE 07088]
MAKPHSPNLLQALRHALWRREHWTAIAIGLLAAPSLPVIAAPPQAWARTPTTNTLIKQDTAAPPVPTRPVNLPAPVTPDDSGIIDLRPSPSDDVGIGQLRPTLEPDPDSSDSSSGASWLRDIALPVYPSPESEPWGWIIHGWLIPNNSSPLAIGRDAAFSMVRTGQPLYTFPVLELRSDGWFRFQYTPAGVAWAHVTHLDLGTVPLAIEPWDISMKDAAQVEFRRPGLSQPMRLEPRSTAPLQALVGPNSIIQPLDLDGDWLRVRVTQPAQGCMPLPGSSVAEGWVRWRNEADVPLVWFSARSC